ncbi:hypothetical protein AAFP30_07760 [Gordonia sp. CPCC 205515]|uniref:hypothetical protein n=1 Tax=Gordonia sp. CPCC 205515 TaxID=3140791 RepID=UPI003AF3698F
MSPQGFTDEYAPTGCIRLGAWSMEPTHADMVTCRATIAYADRIMSLQAQSTGPIGAMTSILYDLGAPVQIVRFHQREVDGAITTYLLCENDDRQCWACGTGDTRDEANFNALIAGANRLLDGAA